MIKLQSVVSLNIGGGSTNCNDCAVMTVCGTDPSTSQKNAERFHS